MAVSYGFLKRVLPRIQLPDAKSLCKFLKDNSGSQNFTGLFRTLDVLSLKASFEFFRVMLPKMLRWATKSKYCERKISILRQKECKEITLERGYIRHLLANAFFLNCKKVAHSSLGNLDLAFLYACEDGIEKILCLLSYFYQELARKEPLGVVRYRRVFDEKSLPDWEHEQEKCHKVVSTLRLSLDRMEEFVGCQAMVDFASKQIHVGRVTPSATQEEILFACTPEALPCLLFAETLLDSEVLLIENVHRYSDHHGYLDSFLFAGCHPRVNETFDIVVMDAAEHSHFRQEEVLRDLNKAYLGFRNTSATCIGTGKWGCGVSRADPCLKFIQQLCAAQMARKSLTYSTFGDEKSAQQFQRLAHLIYARSVPIHRLVSYCVQNKEEHFGDWLEAEIQKNFP